MRSDFSERTSALEKELADCNSVLYSLVETKKNILLGYLSYKKVN